jgi:FMN phosphatase YigB (HAD superfamily)
MVKALLFDVGDVLMLSNWEMFDEFERLCGHVIAGRGPLDPEGDPDWAPYLRGEIDGYGYWDRKAHAAGFADAMAMFKVIGDELPDIFAADAMALVTEARAAGLMTGILSNDLVRISGNEWVDKNPSLQGFDVFVDATVIGFRKPSPEGYAACIAGFGLPAHEIVFLDDTPFCIEAARKAGMIGVHVDPTNRARAFDQVRQIAGIAPSTVTAPRRSTTSSGVLASSLAASSGVDPSSVDRSSGSVSGVDLSGVVPSASDPPRVAASGVLPPGVDPSGVVHGIEAALAAGDIGALGGLLHPQVMIEVNGRTIATGLSQARAFFFRSVHPSAPSRRTVLDTAGDTAYVENAPYGAGSESRRPALESWTVRYGRLIELRRFGAEMEE